MTGTQPEAARPARNEQQRGAASGATKTGAAPAVAAPTPAKPDAKPEAKRETAQPAAVKQPAQPQPARQVERPVKSPKDKAAASEKGATKTQNADDQKKGRGPETSPN